MVSSTKSFDFNIVSFKAPPTPEPSAPTSTLQGTCSIKFTTSSQGNDPLYPATQLLFSVEYPSEEDVDHPPRYFLEQGYTRRDIIPTDEFDQDGAQIHQILIPASKIGRMRVKPGASVDAVILVNAWAGLSLLGEWRVGEWLGAGMLINNEEGEKKTTATVTGKDSRTRKVRNNNRFNTEQVQV